MQNGKLSWEILQKILFQSNQKPDSLLFGPKEGYDVAVFDFHKAQLAAQQFYHSSDVTYIVFKTDPITFPTPNPGKYAVIINANDVVTSGALPYGFNATIILPSKTSEDTFLQIQKEIQNECLNNNIILLGGHSEISSVVNSPVISGAMIGFVPRDYFVTREIHVDDVLLCIGWCAKEGVGIIASKGYSKLLNKMKKISLDKLRNLGKDLSLIDICLEINKKYHPFLMHDATEGGILGAAYEAISVENFGLDLYKDKFPITKETKELCSLFEINPLKLISSGTLLVVGSEAQASELLKKSTIACPISIIGKITSREKGILLDGEKVPPPQPDELIKALEKINRDIL